MGKYYFINISKTLAGWGLRGDQMHGKTQNYKGKVNIDLGWYAAVKFYMMVKVMMYNVWQI